MTKDCKNLPDASARNVGRELYILVGVSVGLLCILQAAVNISLHLALYIHDAGTLDFEATNKNLTEEVETLKRKLNVFDHYSKQGWVYFNHSFYYISPVTKSWQESRADCLQRGADLVIINSKEEQDFMRQFKRLAWIGLTDTETEGIWKWVDGTLLETSYWKTGEPNNFQGIDENCVEIKLYKNPNSWNDKPCKDPTVWICEKMVAV